MLVYYDYVTNMWGKRQNYCGGINLQGENFFITNLFVHTRSYDERVQSLLLQPITLHSVFRSLQH